MKIALVGDIAMFGRYCIKNNSKLFDEFEPVKNFLSQFDIVIGNLEAPFCVNQKGILGKSATVSSHPENIALLKYLNITHLNLANNHIGDFGMSAYESTKKILESNGLDWFGTENKQVRLKINNEKISLLGFCSHNTNPSKVKSASKKGLNYLKATDVFQRIKENVEDGYFSILSVHSGQEHVDMPSIDDIKFARAIASKHNYVFYGHHPHVIQGHEKINGSAIYYSLGNFIFDDVYTPRDKSKPLVALSEDNKTGLIAELEIKDGNLISSRSNPIYLGEKQILLGKDLVQVDLNRINSLLDDSDSDHYELIRMKKISNYIEGRHKLRDLNWYLNRLNLNSIGILYKAKINSSRYKKEFSTKIDLYEKYL